ncbi:cytochrome c oxidase subunit 4 [Myceligenerans pegani]|uniref:Cytochrome c oxidase polypeptide 4 n=1 Tax=Myceligenerans pegani TaxID=2776917 RepID=A0ABR9N0P0_9MICO|nr:cytochrome c oxidase subunit 4 [Myceligenerans sp. TRM 65318]MBE1877218.1 cytochrome c oxidase subunit 4 [Myceligenerans sp. TRM 65318]MBE3019489.1 cytochrome c oxidase subunit 4 [Myceligenerans sp. TRM 65318]
MKIETRLFIAGAPLFFLAAIVYGFWTYSISPDGHWEPVGTLGILLVGAMVFMVGFYLMLTAKRIDERPEDSENAEIADGAGDQGVFAPWSWWPLAIAGSAALAFLAMAVGWWIMGIAVPLGIIALIGWVFEFSRGTHAH